MLQPKFTRWPWGVLALLAPALAAVAAAFHYYNELPISSYLPDERLWRSGCVFFGVLGAANGYLIGIAIGDLLRSVLAVPLGAAMAYAATQLLHTQVGAIAVSIVLGLIMLNAVSNGVKILFGCFVTMLLMVIMMTIVASDGGSLTRLILAYPLICSIITASMPLERSLEGLFGAFLVGARSSLYGMVAGVVASCVGMSAFKMLEVFVPGGVFSGIFSPGTASVAIGAMASNVYCMKLLFDAVYRVGREGEDERPVAKLDADADPDLPDPIPPIAPTAPGAPAAPIASTPATPATPSAESEESLNLE